MGGGEMSSRFDARFSHVVTFQARVSPRAAPSHALVAPRNPLARWAPVSSSTARAPARARVNPRASGGRCSFVLNVKRPASSSRGVHGSVTREVDVDESFGRSGATHRPMPPHIVSTPPRTAAAAGLAPERARRARAARVAPHGTSCSRARPGFIPTSASERRGRVFAERPSSARSCSKHWVSRRKIPG